MDRPKRPPPLALAPPKKQDKSVFRQTLSIPPAACKPRREPPRRASSSRSSQRPSHEASPPPSWVHLATNVLHLHLCAILIAALATFLHDQPAASRTQIGQTATVAIVFLILDTLLSLLTLLRPANHIALFIRLSLAICLLAIFIAFAAHVPGPRVFTPGYRLWGTARETGDGLVAGAVFVVAMWDFARVAVRWRVLLQWLHGRRLRNDYVDDGGERGKDSVTVGR